MSSIRIKDADLAYDTPLAGVLPADLAEPLREVGIETAEDLYECAANVGARWFQSVPGINADRATALIEWLARCGGRVGEVTERFYLPGRAPGAKTEARKAGAPAPEGGDLTLGARMGVVPLERLSVPEELSGAHGRNRAPGMASALDAPDDLTAIRTWLTARAANGNTAASYRKEAERFLLWCICERQTPLSSIMAGDAALYLHWLEGLGRTDPKAWSRQWRLPQACWIGPKNASRDSDEWHPFNGPLQASSRKYAIVVVRQLFSFLTKTGYLLFNPFDQVSPKVPYLKGEGVPKAFADRSLTEEQWGDITACIGELPEGWPRERMKLILMMGKSLGMRAAEMVDATTDWIEKRRVGFRSRAAISIVGKGSKVRILALNDEQLSIVESALRSRGFASLADAPAGTPLLINLGRGPHPNEPMTRTGLYRVLKDFFAFAAERIAGGSPRDAAKLRAASTHWLRHTFAVNALKETSVNIVQAAMGHSSVATTGRYLRPDEETLSEAMEKMKVL